MTRKSAGLAVVIGLALAARGLAAPPQIKRDDSAGGATRRRLRGDDPGREPDGQPDAGRAVRVRGRTTGGPQRRCGQLEVQGQRGGRDSRSGSIRSGSRPMTGCPTPSSSPSASSRRSPRRRRTTRSRRPRRSRARWSSRGRRRAIDVDYFRFAGKKGERIVVDAQCARIGSGVDPSIRLTTAGRAYVASADDSAGLLTDARLTATLPEDTDYVIELSDSRYQGGGRPVYRLVVGAVPVADEVFPLGGRQGETVGFELRGGTCPT